MNLTKIQSLPKIETPWKYSFFVDITFDKYEDYHKKSLLEIMADYLKFGENIQAVNHFKK
jgi:prephenate dehydratase